MSKKGDGWGFSTIYMGGDVEGGCGSYVCFDSYFGGGVRGVFVWLDLII